jgi:hypothetical protein
MRVSRLAVAALALAAFAAGSLLASGFRSRSNPPAAPAWQEISWPFPRDAWPAGRAFRCKAAECGAGVELYVRPKIGFCNCTVGVADDEEVDRVSDLDLAGANFLSAEPGQEIAFAGMPGRARRYLLQTGDGGTGAALAFAVSRQCDVVVALAKGPAASSSRMRRLALDLLSSAPLAAWLASFESGQ